MSVEAPVMTPQPMLTSHGLHDSFSLEAAPVLFEDASTVGDPTVSEVIPQSVEVSEYQAAQEARKQGSFHRFGKFVTGKVAALKTSDGMQDTSAQEAVGWRSKAKKVAKGEGKGLALEVGLRAAGLSLPVREMAGTALDLSTYSPENAEKNIGKTVKRSLGILALNLVTGYAIQKGMPGALDFVSHNIQGTPLQTGFELSGKVAAMLGGSALLEKRIG